MKKPIKKATTEIIKILFIPSFSLSFFSLFRKRQTNQKRIKIRENQHSIQIKNKKKNENRKQNKIKS